MTSHAVGAITNCDDKTAIATAPVGDAPHAEIVPLAAAAPVSALGAFAVAAAGAGGAAPTLVEIDAADADPPTSARQRHDATTGGASATGRRSVKPPKGRTSCGSAVTSASAGSGPTLDAVVDSEGYVTDVMRAELQTLGVNTGETVGNCIRQLINLRSHAAWSSVVRIDAATSSLKRVYIEHLAELSDVDPRAFDVMLQDVNEPDLDLLCEQFAIARNTRVQLPVQLAMTIDGTFYGRHYRVFVPLHVTLARASGTGPTVVAPFLFDTGSPFSFLSVGLLTALGYTDTLPASAEILIQGIPTHIKVGVSHKQFEGLELLGQDAMRALRATVNADYSRLTFSITLR